MVGLVFENLGGVLGSWSSLEVLQDPMRSLEGSLEVFGGPRRPSYLLRGLMWISLRTDPSGVWSSKEYSEEED